MRVITQGLNLPKIAKCDNKVEQVFKMREINKIEPQINFIAQRYKKKTEKLKMPEINEEFLKLQN